MIETGTLMGALAIVAAGFGAGFINVLVGSGTLITFPVLLMFGYPALTANTSSSIGLVAGNFSGVWGYRKEIANLKPVVKKLLPASLIGGLVGASLLLILPSTVFDVVVPILIALGILLVAVGPLIQRRTMQSIKKSSGEPYASEIRRPVLTFVTVLLLGIYGGYFGAAQGVLMVGFLGIIMGISLQGLNALKNMLVAVVNLVSTVIFTVFAFDILNWWVVLGLAVGATAGGLVGGKIGRRLPPVLLRIVIVVVGMIALINMIV